MESSKEVPIEESEGSVEEITDKKKALKCKNKRIKTDAIPAKNPLPNPISREVKSTWVRCLVIGRVREKITTPIKPSKNP